jgi:hypothetical protein
VVTSIVINAAYQGQKVLFASKNNKAVDVVQERVNGLTSRQIMLRLGRNELLVELEEYLSGLLSATASVSDHQRYNEAQEKHQKLSDKFEAINRDCNNLIEIRNQTDRLEREIESYRFELGEELFSQIKTWNQTKFDDIHVAIKKVNMAFDKADKNKQSLLLRLIWNFLKKSRLEIARLAFQDLKQFIFLLRVDSTDRPLDENSLNVYYEVKKQVSDCLASPGIGQPLVRLKA